MFSGEQPFILDTSVGLRETDPGGGAAEHPGSFTPGHVGFRHLEKFEGLEDKTEMTGEINWDIKGEPFETLREVCNSSFS